MFYATGQTTCGKTNFVSIHPPTKIKNVNFGNLNVRNETNGRKPEWVIMGNVQTWVMSILQFRFLAQRTSEARQTNVLVSITI